MNSLSLDQEYIKISAVASSLPVILCSLITPAYKHWKKNNIIKKSSFYILAFSAIGGAYLASILLNKFTFRTFFLGFIFLQVLIGLKLIVPSNLSSNSEVSFTKIPTIALLIIIGLFSGGVSSFFGIGGGIVTIPLLYFILKMPMIQSIGTSICLILISTSIGLISYIYQGSQISNHPITFYNYIFIPFILIVTPSAIIGAFLGEKIVHRINENKLRIIFACFVLSLSLFEIYAFLK